MLLSERVPFGCGASQEEGGCPNGRAVHEGLQGLGRLVGTAGARYVGRMFLSLTQILCMLALHVMPNRLLLVSRHRTNTLLMSGVAVNPASIPPPPGSAAAQTPTRGMSPSQREHASREL